MLYRTTKLLLAGLLLVSLIICGTLDSSAAEKKHLVAIDPAHGGQDTGVQITDKIAEKDITLAIALALQKELLKNGNYEIVLTRDSDKTISSEDRRKDVSKVKPELFLSLHINGGFGKSASGFEIYYPGFKQINDQKKQSKDGSKDVKNNKYLNDSVKLAQIIAKNLDALFPRKRAGIKRSPNSYSGRNECSGRSRGNRLCHQSGRKKEIADD